MAKQYHFTIVARDNGDGSWDVYMDDADSGIFPEGTVFNEETDEWEIADTDMDMVAFAAAEEVITLGLMA